MAFAAAAASDHGVGAGSETAAEVVQDLKAHAIAVEGRGTDLQARSGVIKLGDNLAQLTVPPGFVFLSPADAQTFLTEVWGNPPSALGLGMLLPLDPDPSEPEGWGVVVDYEDSGHVSDSDAGEIDYDTMLRERQAGEAKVNAERARLGYPGIHLVNWATRPHYDINTHKLYWAEELQFGDSPDTVLNYFVRVLGREGHLVLNAVADSAALAAVSQRMEEVIAAVEFAPEQRYEAYDPTIHRAAVAGIAALVAGKIAAKAGVFVVVAAVLKKFGVLIFVAGAGLARRLFRRRRGAPAAPGPEAPAASGRVGAGE